MPLWESTNVSAPLNNVPLTAIVTIIGAARDGEGNSIASASYFFFAHPTLLKSIGVASEWAPIPPELPDNKFGQKA